MRRYKSALPALVAMLASGSMVRGGTTNIVFQQGLNGYGGCQDSFVNTSAYGEDNGVNFGINQFLILNSEHFESF